MQSARARWGAVGAALVLCLAAIGVVAAQETDQKAPAEQPAPRQRGRGPNPARQNPQGQAPREGRPASIGGEVIHDPTGLVPLTDMGDQKYKDQDGGLYGGGSNEPPEAHAALARKALAQILPRDADGKPAADGKVVMVSIGMSNTTMEFRVFKQMGDADPTKSPHVVIVDTAQGGRSAGAWAKSLSGNTRRSRTPREGQEYRGTPGENTPDQEKYGAAHTVWEEADRRVRLAGCTPRQVQVAWIKVAGSVKKPYPDHLAEYEGHLEKIATLAKARWPNLQIAYLSSRIYAGYATSLLNPEPWSYESAFGVRAVILKQAKGDAGLNADPARGEVKAAVLLWGPYMWADGTKPRKSDGFAWEQKNFGADGTHPSSSGTKKVGEQLLRFLTTNPLAKPWFTGKPATNGDK